jgi:hypothetical protein
MNFDKNKLVYAGIGLFFLLVYLNSSKNVQLVEVSATPPSNSTISFDSSILPHILRPPTRLAESEPLPVNNNIKKTSANGINFMPRFDF